MKKQITDRVTDVFYLAKQIDTYFYKNVRFLFSSDGLIVLYSGILSEYDMSNIKGMCEDYNTECFRVYHNNKCDTFILLNFGYSIVGKNSMNEHIDSFIKIYEFMGIGTISKEQIW